MVAALALVKCRWSGRIGLAAWGWGEEALDRHPGPAGLV